jgi:hypothetical protein
MILFLELWLHFPSIVGPMRLRRLVQYHLAQKKSRTKEFLKFTNTIARVT